MAKSSERPGANPDTAFEPADWPVGTVALVLLAAMVLLIVAPLALMVAFPAAVSDTSRRLTVEPPPPRLQVHPSRDLARLRAEEQKRLDSYYWIDKQKGIVHIPIARAMQEIAAKGIPGFPRAPR